MAPFTGQSSLFWIWTRSNYIKINWGSTGKRVQGSLFSQLNVLFWHGNNTLIQSIKILWQIRDFPEGEGKTKGGVNLLLDQFFPKTAWKWRDFDPEGGRPSLAPLDTPMSSSVLEIFFLLFFMCVRGDHLMFGRNNFGWHKSDNKVNKVPTPPQKKYVTSVLGICVKSPPQKYGTLGFHQFWTLDQKQAPPLKNMGLKDFTSFGLGIKNEETLPPKYGTLNFHQFWTPVQGASFCLVLLCPVKLIFPL